MTAEPLAPDQRAQTSLPMAALAAAVIGSILFSGKGILTKAGMHLGADSLQMLALRMAFAAPVFAVLLAWSLSRQAKDKPVQPRDLAQAAGLGLLGCWLSPILNFYGLRTVSASLERILIYACPVFVLLFAFLLGRERVSRKGMAALCVSYLGVVIAILGRDGGNPSADPLGTMAILGSCVTYSLFVVFSVRMQSRIGVATFTSMAMLVSSIACVVHLSVLLGPQVLLSPPPGTIPLALALAWACMVLPSYLVAFSIKSLGAGRSSVVQMVGPLFTPIAAALVLGEHMSAPQVGGFALVLTGGLLLSAAKG